MCLTSPLGGVWCSHGVSGCVDAFCGEVQPLDVLAVVEGLLDRVSGGFGFQCRRDGVHHLEPCLDGVLGCRQGKLV